MGNPMKKMGIGHDCFFNVVRVRDAHVLKYIGLKFNLRTVLKLCLTTRQVGCGSWRSMGAQRAR